MHSNLREPAFV